MNKLINALIGAAIATASVSAFAGPDWNVIDKARKAKQTEQAAAPALSTQTAGPKGTVRFAELDPAVQAAMMKECADMMKERK